MGKEDWVCTDRIKPRKIISQNIVLRLFRRENGIYRRGYECEQTVQRQFYQNIVPNLTVINVEKPAGYLRKFTPDGKHLIAFSYDQSSLEIYKFNGVAAAATLLYPWKDDYVPSLSRGIPFKIRSGIFDKLFKLKFIVNVAMTERQLNRECSLFTNDSKYVILGGTSQIYEENRPSFYEIYTSNEAITPNTRCMLEDCTIYLVDIQNGCVSDSIDFNVDRIFLSHNQGIYLYNNTFAVLSIFHQTIHIYEIFNGKFVQLHKIGRFTCDLEYQLYCATFPTYINRPFREVTINSLKHRILTFMYKRAKDKCMIDGDYYQLRKFYQFFDLYNNLRMWRMQLIDEDHLLIKYASEEVVGQRAIEPNSHPSFFVFYNIPEAKVIEVLDNTSRKLLYLLDNFCDMFRNIHALYKMQYPCSPSNNIYSKLITTKYKVTIISARGGGVIEAIKRILAQLPISAQSYSVSPYLDLNLFSYDDKWISVMERPKASSENPIRFYDRDSGLLRFRIYPGLMDKPSSPPISSPPSSSPRRLVAFTFHPTEPFAISVQRLQNEYIVNFHIRNEATRLMK